MRQTSERPQSGRKALSLLTVIILAVMTVAGALPARAAETPLESVAHRGDKEYHPDNSLEGIASAIGKGADWVEIDLHYNRDGDAFFLAHDNFCSGPGGTALIDSSSYERVVANCDLPELDDVFSQFTSQGFTGFVYEFKATALTSRDGGMRLAQKLSEQGIAASSWISSFSDSALTAAQAQGTGAKLMRVRPWTGSGTITRLWIDRTAELGFDAINVNITALSEDRIAHARGHGLLIAGWAWPDAMETHNQTAIDQRLDMFMTDRLDDLHRRLGR